MNDIIDLQILRYILLTLIPVSVSFFLFFFIRKAIRVYGTKKNISVKRQLMLERFVLFFLFLVAFITIIGFWKIKLSSLWVYITSGFALIGFVLFSKFSLLSNIFSAFLIYFTVPVKVGDQISLFPTQKKKIKGKIIEMNLFHIILLDKDDNQISIPNNKFLEEPISLLSSDPKPEIKTNHLHI